MISKLKMLSYRVYWALEHSPTPEKIQKIAVNQKFDTISSDIASSAPEFIVISHSLSDHWHGLNSFSATAISSENV